MINPMRATLRCAWIAILIVGLSAMAFAQANRSTLKPGEALITVARGTAQAEVNRIAESVNADVIFSFGTIDFQQLRECYHLRLRGNQATVQATTDAVEKLKNTQGVVGAWPNSLYYPAQTGGTVKVVPNDPRFSEQWGLTQIKMPEAWTLEKGKSNVAIAVIDTGTDIDHPDFQGRAIIGPYNSVNQSTDPRPGTGPFRDHGTLVAGLCLATTNNGVGIAGVGWEGIRLMPINASADGATFADADLLRAYQHVLAQKNANPGITFIMNLSLGGVRPSDVPDVTNLPPSEQQILTNANSGILVCIAAGNNFELGNQPFGPAYLAGINGNIICVTGTAENGAKASYSEARPYSTVAAPAGDAPINGRGMLGLVPVADGSYAVFPGGGTSSACPHVSGVAALLLSVPGVNVADIKPLLQQTATRVSGFAVPSPEFGYGIVNAYDALSRVAVAVTIAEPEGTGGKAVGNTTQPQPIETLQPVIRIQVRQIFPADLIVTIDGTTVPLSTSPTQAGPSYTIENVTVTGKDQAGVDQPLSYDVVIRNAVLSPGQHNIGVVGTKPGTPPRSVSDTRNITITPHVIPAGRSMISIPYYQVTDKNGDGSNDIAPEDYFGTDFRLARWIPDQERYAFYSPLQPMDPLAAFVTPGRAPHQDNDLTPKFPLGLGYWMDAGSAKPVLTRGLPVTDRAFVIPLKGNGSGNNRFISWNMIGDPFPFDIPFNALLVDTPTGRITIAEAAAQGLILPNIYTYDGENGYSFRTLPDGALRAWTGHWVGVTSAADISLVVPPARVTRAASTSPRATQVPDGWTLQIGAHVRKLHDTYNFIGTTSRAADAYDRLDVQKPPMPSEYVSVGISHTDWPGKNGLYAQDIRAAGGTKSWPLVVMTDQTDSNVTLSWNGATLPRNVRLRIKDETSGQVVDMRTRASLTFNAGAEAAPRKFTITATPGMSAPTRISNLSVQPLGGRSSGVSAIRFTLSSDATYEVRVLNSAGGSVGTIASRAAGAGDVQLVWNGKDAAGRSVASGTYLVQIKAMGPDGDSVRVVQPFAVVR